MGAPLTDVRIRLVAGRAHQKHTEGGDFRQAVYRALRQGLMQAENILLEPYYEFRLMVPEGAVGRAMTDLDKMQGKFTLEHNAGGMACLAGAAPMVLLQDYQREVTAYTKGMGQLYCTLKGYFPCHNTEEVLEEIGYDPLSDVENPSSSVFCAHGAGFIVEWDRVPDYMHLESCLSEDRELWRQEDCGWKEWEENWNPGGKAAGIRGGARAGQEAGADLTKGQWIGTEEVDAIISRTSGANRKENREGTRSGWGKGRGGKERDSFSPSQTRTYRTEPPKEKYLLVDGYNVIFAWEELKELAKENLDGARGALLDILCNYQAVKQCRLIAVFDAYRLAGHPTETLDYHNIHVVYTKEAETADQYIEKFAHENSRKYDVTVATSDGLEQIIIVGAGCKLISSRELKEEIEQTAKKVMEEYRNGHPKERASLGQALSGQAAEKIKEHFMGTEE
ncbi:MAG: NYN domain-containing protein, partial [Lachnospiraceae bacterium]|nr:NYN domain-containing protein [Lachnospiraceae bacterium]